MNRPEQTLQRTVAVPRRSWSAVETDRLITLRGEGVRGRQIAIALGRSAASIQSHLAILRAAGRIDRLEGQTRRKVDPVAEFQSRVDRSRGKSACWPWTASCTARGYGKLSFRIGNFKPDALAHRVAFFLANGWLPERGLVVRHTCDNPPCCNPLHLISGTHRENALDCIERDRHGRGAPHGEASPKAKLTDAVVREMRLLNRAGVGHKRLARRFGVSPATARKAIRGSSWAHVK